VVALAPDEESNIKVLQHAMEEDVQYQQVDDEPMVMVEADVEKEDE
jgi:hypothetical protein